MHVCPWTPRKSEKDYTLSLREGTEGLSRSALPNKLHVSGMEWLAPPSQVGSIISIDGQWLTKDVILHVDYHRQKSFFRLSAAHLSCAAPVQLNLNPSQCRDDTDEAVTTPDKNLDDISWTALLAFGL